MKILSLFSRKSKKKEDSEKLIQNLIGMARADGHFDESEKKFVQTIAESENIGKKALELLLANHVEGEQLIPEDEDLKFNQFYLLVRMMLADNNIHDQEWKLIRSWADRFGYGKKNPDELIDSIIQNIHNGQDVKSTQMRVSWLLQ